MSSLQTDEDDEPLSSGQQPLLIHCSSPITSMDHGCIESELTREFSNGRGLTNGNFRGQNEERVLKVKKLSRLWLYRNDERSPKLMVYMGTLLECRPFEEI
jgi:hypothetical protein